MLCGFRMVGVVWLEDGGCCVVAGASHRLFCHSTQNSHHPSSLSTHSIFFLVLFTAMYVMFPAKQFMV